MKIDVAFKPLEWESLRKYLLQETSKINRDVDKEVREMTFSQFCEQFVEGFYLGESVIGFARWDKRNYHLSNLYVSPEYRGNGVARAFVESRTIRTLYVMPHNHDAKRLYTQLGFVASPCAVPTREFMMRHPVAKRA